MESPLCSLILLYCARWAVDACTVGQRQTAEAQLASTINALLRLEEFDSMPRSVKGVHSLAEAILPLLSAVMVCGVLAFEHLAFFAAPPRCSAPDFNKHGIQRSRRSPGELCDAHEQQSHSTEHPSYTTLGRAVGATSGRGFRLEAAE